MDLAGYFRRIGYEGERAATLAVLRELARLQPMAIAFENIAVAAGMVPELDRAAVAAKLVAGGRGGYCYEQNTLLQAALEALGFRVTVLAARVRYQLPAEVVTSRGHMVLLVELPEGAFLVDAGFGGLTLTAPVALQTDAVQATPHEAVRCVKVGGDLLVQAELVGRWFDVYQFDRSVQLPADVEQMNWYTATRPGALFAQNVIATRPVPGGRHTLFNRTLSFRAPGQKPQRQVVAGAAALGEALGDVFGLLVPKEQLALAAEVAARAGEASASFD